MPLVSIIVPVYKAEQCLHRCVDSILAQTMTDFELLLIDDGSPDKSGEICDEYAAKDNRVRVFHKDNGGVSSARNLGLDNATGEWISFIDADDWVEKEYLAELAKKLDADFIVGGVNIIGSHLCQVESKKYDKSQIKFFIEENCLKVVLLSPWGNLLKKELINKNNVRFDEKIRYAEDRIFNREYLLCCESIISVSTVNYNYMIETQINYANKFKLSIKELDYLCYRLEKLNKSLEIHHACVLNKDELKKDILSMFYFKHNMDMGIFNDFFDLCKKYYPNLIKKTFYRDPFLSPLINCILQIKALFSCKKYKEAKLLFEQLSYLNKDIPWDIRFNYKDFYLWLFFIKLNCWFSFKLTMKIFIIFK